MWSLPESWEFSVSGLASILPEGKGAIRAALKELEQYGYLLREQVNSGGKFGPNIYVLHDEPTVVQFYDNGKCDDEEVNTINSLKNKLTKKEKTSSKSACEELPPEVNPIKHGIEKKSDPEEEVFKRNWTY